jgi:hypothetical protein
MENKTTFFKKKKHQNGVLKIKTHIFSALFL